MRKEVFEDDNLRKHLPWFLTSKIKFFLGLLALFAVPLTLWIGLKSFSLSLLVFVFVMLTALGFVAVSWFERYNHAMMLQTRELVSAKDHLDKIINALPDPVFVKDRRHHFTLMNDPCCRFLGYTRQALIGKSDYEFFPKKEADIFWEKDELVFTGGGENLNEEEIMNSKGDVFTILTKKTLYIDSSGAPYIIGTIRDITEQKRADAQMLQKIEELGREKAEREQLELFAYVASHDLQEPLRAISGFGEILEKHLTGKLDETFLSYLQKMRLAAVRMSRLIDDILRFSRVIRQSELFEPVSLNGVLSQVMEDLGPKIHQLGAEVRIEPLPTVLGDKTQLRQLFLNLLFNSLKFRDPAKPKPVIHVRCLEDSDHLRKLAIEDNGIGFDPKHQEDIFNPFQRLHNRQQFEGNGMGLAICRKVVTNHYGKIYAEGRPGQGATFFVELSRIAIPS